MLCFLLEAFTNKLWSEYINDIVHITIYNMHFLAKGEMDFLNVLKNIVNLKRINESKLQLL